MENNNWLDLLHTAKITEEAKKVIADFYLRGDYIFVEALLVEIAETNYSVVVDSLIALLPQNVTTKITKL